MLLLLTFVVVCLTFCCMIVATTVKLNTLERKTSLRITVRRALLAYAATAALLSAGAVIGLIELYSWGMDEDE